MFSARAINRVILAMLAVALILAICIPGIRYWKSKAPDRARQRFNRLQGTLHRNVAKFQLELPILPEALEQLKQIQGIDTVDFSGHPVGLEAAKVCAELDQIRAVAFGKAKINSQAFAEFAKMRQLQVLFLSEMADTKGLLAEIGQFQKLDTLYLDKCNLDEETSQWIAKHPRLGKVVLTEATIEAKALPPVLGKLNLRELWLQRVKLNSAPDEKIDLSASSSVQTLLWFGNDDDFAIYGDYLLASDKLPNLQTLVLGCQSNEVLACIRKAQAHQNLTALRLFVDKMPARADFPALKQLSANFGIEIIDKQYNIWDNTRGYQPNVIEETKP